MRRLSSVTTALLLTATVAACSDTLGPADSMHGRYALVSLDAKPLPVLLNEFLLTRIYLVGDTLTFDGHGKVAEVYVGREDTIATAGTHLLRQESSLGYKLRGDSIYFATNCPPYADCIAPPIGARLPDGGFIMGYPMTEGLAFVRRYEPVP